ISRSREYFKRGRIPCDFCQQSVKYSVLFQ
ncbi:hypothetical protein DBR06_SOUSAS6210049, partial [Sousa chinensis]